MDCSDVTDTDGKDFFDPKIDPSDSLDHKIDLGVVFIEDQ